MRRVGFLLFSVILLLALYGVNRFVIKRGLLAFDASPKTSSVSRGVLLAVLCCVFASRGLWFLWPTPAYKLLALTASSIELGLVFSAFLLAAERLFFGAQSAIASLFKRKPLNEVQPANDSLLAVPDIAYGTKPDVKRRQFLTQAGVGGAICLGQSLAGYATARGRVDYQLEEAPVRIAGLPRHLDGFCIAQLSDVHIGQFTGEWELSVAKEFLRRARPDLIVITGDLIDQQISLAPMLGRFVRSLEGIARHGVVTVSGNHDFYAGVDEVEATLRNAGVPMLRNQGLFIGERSSAFALLGVDDVWGNREGRGPHLGRAVKTLNTEGAHALGIDANSARAQALAVEAPRVLLCHNPVFFEQSAGKVALQLSGHTHGGQLVPGGQILRERWIAGAYCQSGTQLYVNRGFGTVGPPSRLGAPPEITRHILLA